MPTISWEEEGGGWFKDLDKLRLNHFIWLVFEAMNLN